MKRHLLLLGALVLANLLVVWGQQAVFAWKWTHEVLSIFSVDGRYYFGSFVLLLPILPWLFLRFRHGRKALVVGMGLLGIAAVAFLVKARVPSSNRHAKMAACDWAVATIRADYQGPRMDAEPHFSLHDYHRDLRPVVESFSVRVPYLLGGRQANLVAGYLRDIPDYIVDEPSKAKRLDWWCVADYRILAEKKFGKRDYVIYKRERK